MCTPSSGPSASATSFTRPSVSPRISARRRRRSGASTTTTSWPALARLLLGEPAPRDLGVAVDRPTAPCRSRPASTGSPRIVFTTHDRLREADVRELRRVDHVAGRVHAGTFVRSWSSTTTKPRSSTSTPDVLEPEAAAARRPPDAHDDLVDDDRLLARRRSPTMTVSSRAPSMPVTRADVLHVDAALLERAGDDVADVDVGRRRGCAAAPRAA